MTDPLKTNYAESITEFSKNITTLPHTKSISIDTGNGLELAAKLFRSFCEKKNKNERHSRKTSEVALFVEKLIFTSLENSIWETKNGLVRLKQVKT